MLKTTTIRNQTMMNFTTHYPKKVLLQIYSIGNNFPLLKIGYYLIPQFQLIKEKLNTLSGKRIITLSS